MRNLSFMHNYIQYIIDPLNKFPFTEPEVLMEAVGLIPTFINPLAEDVMEEALINYGMSICPMTGGVVNKEGVYQYPGDPDLYPITRCKVGGKTIYIYSYGIIAFVADNSGETVVHRFD